MRSHWKVFISALIIFLIVGFCGRHMFKQSDHLRVDVSRTATLVQAYEYDERCGHKGRYNCSAYKGRFLIEPEHIYLNREIDGFFYHNYVDKGRKDMAAYVTVSKVDLGVKEPPYTGVWEGMMVSGFFLFIAIFLVGGIACLFADEDIRDRQRRGW